MTTITEEMSQAGLDMAAIIYDVTVDTALNSGNMDLSALDDAARKIVEDYMAGNIKSTDAIYLAMDRVRNR